MKTTLLQSPSLAQCHFGAPTIFLGGDSLTIEQKLSTPGYVYTNLPYEYTNTAWDKQRQMYFDTTISFIKG